jgi:hypothetical protein
MAMVVGCGPDLGPIGPDLGCWVSAASQLSGERQQRCGRKSLPVGGGRWRGLWVVGHVGEGGRSVRHFNHDVEVLRWRRCEQCGRLPHSGGLRGRCAAIRTKVHLRSVPATTAPVGVVPLLGGVAEVCRHSSCSFSGLVDVSGRKLRSGVGSAR